MPIRPKSYRSAGSPSPREQRQQYDRSRGSAAKRGYDRRWREYRALFLQLHPMCECGPDCCPDGCFLPATDVDHRERVTGPDDPKFWAADNHQGLAHECHSRKTARENAGRPAGC